MFPLRTCEEKEEAAAYPLDIEDKIMDDQEKITNPEERMKIIKSELELSDVKTAEEMTAVDELLRKAMIFSLLTVMKSQEYRLQNTELD